MKNITKIIITLITLTIIVIMVQMMVISILLDKCAVTHMKNISQQEKIIKITSDNKKIIKKLLIDNKKNRAEEIKQYDNGILWIKKLYIGALEENNNLRERLELAYERIKRGRL